MAALDAYAFSRQVATAVGILTRARPLSNDTIRQKNSSWAGQRPVGATALPCPALTLFPLQKRCHSKSK